MQWFVVGENESVNCAIGQGKTIEEAINAWAYNTGYFESAAEFAEHKPAVFQGTQMHVEQAFKYVTSMKI